MYFSYQLSNGETGEIEAKSPFKAAIKLLGRSAQHEEGDVNTDKAVYLNNKNETCTLSAVPLAARTAPSPALNVEPASSDLGSFETGTGLSSWPQLLSFGEKKSAQ